MGNMIRLIELLKQLQIKKEGKASPTVKKSGKKDTKGSWNKHLRKFGKRQANKKSRKLTEASVKEQREFDKYLKSIEGKTVDKNLIKQIRMYASAWVYEAMRNATGPGRNIHGW